MNVINTQLIDSVLVVTINNPPVNALGHEVRTGLLREIAAGAANDTVAAILLRCAGRGWSAGADIREFTDPKPPFLSELVESIEACPKPICAAIVGSALGGGLEVALACHLRIASQGASFGLPEVTLGLIPGAGGTQRLPRLVGVDKALDMMTSGTSIDDKTALRLGLIDSLVEPADLIDGALALIHRRLALKMPIDRVGERALQDGSLETVDRFVAANPRRFRNNKAATAVVEAVRFGLQSPLGQALATERVLFEQLRRSPESAALRYSFFSDRTAAKIPRLGGVTARPVARVGVIGAGTMGTGIALSLLASGLPVVLVERVPAALERGLILIRSTLDRNVASGRITAAARDRALENISTGLDFEAFAEVDLIIEAAFETMEVKTAIFREIDAIAKPGAILASNTSYLDTDEIARATGRPQDVVGLHFFSPANIMKLLEVVKGDRTALDVLSTAMALGKRIGKTCVLAGNAHGFIGNRMLAIRRRESDALVLEGASPYVIDAVLEDFGMPMGPFRMSDLAGLDLGWDRQTSAGRTIRECLCELDRRGQKSGGGYYDYDEAKTAKPSAKVEALIQKFAAAHGRETRAVTKAEIFDRLMLPMISEGARILSEGKALRGSDIDVVWRNGYGWPAWRGGPLYWADGEGLGGIVARLNALQGRLGPQMAPAPLLADLARDGLNLHDYANDWLAE